MNLTPCHNLTSAVLSNRILGLPSPPLLALLYWWPGGSSNMQASPTISPALPSSFISSLPDAPKPHSHAPTLTPFPNHCHFSVLRSKHHILWRPGLATPTRFPCFPLSPLSVHFSKAVSQVLIAQLYFFLISTQFHSKFHEGSDLVFSGHHCTPST